MERSDFLTPKSVPKSVCMHSCHKLLLPRMHSLTTAAKFECQREIVYCSVLARCTKPSLKHTKTCSHHPSRSRFKVCCWCSNALNTENDVVSTQKKEETVNLQRKQGNHPKRSSILVISVRKQLTTQESAEVSTLLLVRWSKLPHELQGKMPTFQTKTQPLLKHI